MKLITDAQREQLLSNGRAQRAAQDASTDEIDLQPVVHDSGTADGEPLKAGPSGRGPGRAE